MNLRSETWQVAKLSALGAFILCCSVILMLLQKSRLAILKNPPKVSREEITRQTIAEKTSLQLWKNLPTYGYDNLLSNWVFLRFLQYFGDDEARDQNDYRLSLDFFEVIVEKDPWFIESYYYLTSSGTVYAGMPQRTVALMQKGLDQMSPKQPSNAYYIWRLKAIDEHLFLGNSHAAIISYLTAADWASQHSDQESQRVAMQSRITAQFLIQNPQSLVAQSGAWSLVLVQAKDEKTRQYALEQIKKIGGTVEFNGNSVSVTVPEKLIQHEVEELKSNSQQE